VLADKERLVTRSAGHGGGEASILPPGITCQIRAPVVALSANTEPA
jgi:hypothetical protein